MGSLAGLPAEAGRCPQVNQGNMPGLQSTFLAMDTEEGVEVVWNELQFTNNAAFTAYKVGGAHRRRGACARSARLWLPPAEAPFP